MHKTYFNQKVKAQITLILEEENLPLFNTSGSFLKFFWNKGPQPISVIIDGQKLTLEADQILCTTYLQKIELPEFNGQVLGLIFNREFYCVHTNDSEVSCNGLLFFGSDQTPVIQLNDHERKLLSYLIEIMIEEFDIDDNNREEMLRILLKRFIIRCTRQAKQQLFRSKASAEDVDQVRLFNVLVEEYFKKLRKVSDYANLMNRSPKTISNLFAKYSDKTPLEIIHQRIIIEAERLFNYSDKTAKEVASELGFPEPAQFSRFFKTLTGRSITDYRKNA